MPFATSGEMTVPEIYTSVTSRTETTFPCNNTGERVKFGTFKSRDQPYLSIRKVSIGLYNLFCYLCNYKNIWYRTLHETPTAAICDCWVLSRCVVVVALDLSIFFEHRISRTLRVQHSDLGFPSRTYANFHIRGFRASGAGCRNVHRRSYSRRQ